MSGGIVEGRLQGGWVCSTGGRPPSRRRLCQSVHRLQRTCECRRGRPAAVHVMPILPYALFTLPAGHRYFTEGADEVAFLNITGFRDCPLEDLPMLQVRVGRVPARQAVGARMLCQSCVFRQPCVGAVPAAGVTMPLSSDTAVAWLAVNSPRRCCKLPVSACLCR